MKRKQNGIIDTLVESTKKLHSNRYQSHKFCYDTNNNSVITYEADREVQWKEYGENDHSKKMRDLTFLVEKVRGQESWFKYF